MRIRNISARTSLKPIIFLFFIVLFFLIGLIYICTFSSPAELFQVFLDIEDLSDKFMMVISFIVCPVILIWLLILTIIGRIKAINKMHSDGLNLKYIDLLQGRIDFKFIKPQYDFTCGYEDIQNLSMNLKTVEIYHKGDTYIVLQEIEVAFKVLNGKTFSVCCTPNKPVNFIYKLIDHIRGIENFSYKFSGAGVNEDINERIEDYLKKGCKQILSTTQEESHKFMSIMFFCISIFIIYDSFNKIVDAISKGDSGILILLIPSLIFLIVAFILDAILIVDKINDRKFGTEHKSDELVGKIPCELITAVQFIIVVVIVFLICKPLIFSVNDRKILQTNSDFEELYVNSPSEFNYLKKDEIYSYRKAYVKDSLFSTNNYEPNEQVFGAIEDYKPWWGTIICQPIDYKGDHHENIEGESQQSIQINNPNALVGLKNVYFMYDRQESDFCTSDYARFIPQSIKYNKKNNLIVAEYKVSKDFLYTYIHLDDGKRRFPLQLSGLNALDFGYKYVYAFDTKNIEMFHSNNITENVEMFKDYIHVGTSCEYEGGCNNISPMQDDKMITVKDLPAEINLKLWKKEPKDKYSKPDIYYSIIFKEQ